MPVAAPQSGPQVAPVGLLVHVVTFEVIRVAGQAGGAGVSAKQVLTNAGG